MRAMEFLRRQLPADVRETLERGEASGDIEGDAYQAAELCFVRRHVCRLDPFPAPLVRTIENTGRSPAYKVMYGRNQFLLTGALRDWDRRTELSRLRMPTLVSCGRHDKFVPACSHELHEAIPDSQLHVFEHSSHMSHLEEPERFVAVVGTSWPAPRTKRLKSHPRSDPAAWACGISGRLTRAGSERRRRESQTSASRPAPG